MKKFLTIFMATLMLVSIAMFATGCGISDDWKETRDKLVDAGFDVTTATSPYSIESYVEDLGMSVDGDDVECVMIAFKGKQTIVIAFCKDKATAKDLVKQAEDFESDFADMIDVSRDKIEIGRDGKVAYMGHKEAVKAAK